MALFGQTAEVTPASKEHMKLIDDRVAAVVNTDVKFDKLTEHYVGWAQEYERDMNTWGYKSPKVAAQLVEKYSGGNKNIKLLDCTAGTGLTGQAIYDAGYKNLSAQDGNHGMLAEAMKKGVYKAMYVTYLGHENLDVPNNHYDIVTMFGSMCDGHINPDCFSCFKDFCTVIKPGGYFIGGIVKECITDDYKKKVDAALEDVVKAGLASWELNEMIKDGEYGEVCWILKVK